MTLTRDQMLQELERLKDEHSADEADAWAYAALDAALAELRTAHGQWRPIATAPKDGTQVLLWITGMEPRARVGFWAERGADSGWYGLQTQHFIGVNVPLWQPLPTPPSSTGASDPQQGEEGTEPRPNGDTYEKILRDWRAQDEALQTIATVCDVGIDVGGVDDVVTSVREFAKNADAIRQAAFHVVMQYGAGTEESTAHAIRELETVFAAIDDDASPLPTSETPTPRLDLEFCPRCSSGPRQQADVTECPDCGYRWAGPRLRDLGEGETPPPAQEKE